jgi:ubiquinone/menaquinone biosynthesis C-methylase UbiE
MSFRQQFARPTGLAGRLVGHILAFKNRDRGEWVVSLLELGPNDRVLEIGFGPGVDVARVAAMTTAGRVAGVDPSSVMVAQACSRNADLVARGVVDLRLGDAGSLPFEDRSFDVVFAINSVQFWADRSASLAEIARVLRPGGRLVVAIQPRSEGATAETTAEWGRELTRDLEAAGLASVRTTTKELSPVPAVAVIATRP